MRNPERHRERPFHRRKRCPHTFVVTASNATGSATDSHTWTVNPQLPTVAITTAPTSGTTATSATFAWTLGGGPTGSVTCTLDGGSVPCTTLSATLSSLSTDASGVSHVFVVTASNVTGPATDSHTWTVNPPPPTVTNVTLTSDDGLPTGPFTVTFTPVLTTGLTCAFDGGPAVSCASGQSFPTADPLLTSHSIVVTPKNVSGDGPSQTAGWSFP